MLSTWPSAVYVVRTVTFVSAEGAQQPLELELLLDDEAVVQFITRLISRGTASNVRGATLPPGSVVEIGFAAASNCIERASPTMKRRFVRSTGPADARARYAAPRSALFAGLLPRYAPPRGFACPWTLRVSAAAAETMMW